MSAVGSRSPVPRQKRLELAPEDMARLHMGEPENPMVIAAALVLERSPTPEALTKLIEARLLRHVRFRTKISEPRWGQPCWLDAAVDLRQHCVWHTGQDKTPTIEDFVQDRLSEPLDRNRPLWRLDVASVDGQAVLLFRVHHVMADGDALVAVLGGLCDEGSAAQPTALQSDQRPAPGLVPRLLGGLVGAVRLAAWSPDPVILGGTLGTRKRVAYSSPLLLADIGASAHAAGATITEVVLAAVASALRAQLATGGGRSNLVVRAMVPVNLRGAAGGATGNDYASVFVSLPLGDLDSHERVRRIGASLRAARSRGSLRASAHLVGAASVVGAPLERRLVRFFSRRASVVVSSVRGPLVPVHLGGILVRDVLVWAPAPGRVPLSVTLMSYAGRVRIGVSADAHVIGDPTPIVDELERELGVFMLRA
jgi:diacylglycerol O-acyltransferase / wax synthase